MFSCEKRDFEAFSSLIVWFSLIGRVKSSSKEELSEAMEILIKFALFDA